VHTAVDEELNPALKKLGLRPIKCNPDTKKVYAASMDGTSVEALLKDLALALVDATPITDDWGLITSPSVFLALYVVSKLHLWPCSNTWYDNECRPRRAGSTSKACSGTTRTGSPRCAPAMPCRVHGRGSR